MPKISIEGGIIVYEGTPDVCPVCRHAVEPRRLDGVVPASRNKREMLQIAYQCVRTSCRQMFIATYDRPRDVGNLYLRSVAPKHPKPPEIPKEVAEISPQFVEVMNQSAAAEDYDLLEAAGVGYRKALEFLVKDFCITSNPTEAAAIKSAFLGSVIDKYVDSANIKSCAKRAVWLGNDETHYERRWEGKDLADLKILIQLTVGWIRDHVLTAKYLEDMK